MLPLKSSFLRLASFQSLVRRQPPVDWPSFALVKNVEMHNNECYDAWADEDGNVDESKRCERPKPGGTAATADDDLLALHDWIDDRLRPVPSKTPDALAFLFATQCDSAH